jgi:hypothetical protein
MMSAGERETAAAEAAAKWSHLQHAGGVATTRQRGRQREVDFSLEETRSARETTVLTEVASVLLITRID